MRATCSQTREPSASCELLDVGAAGIGGAHEHEREAAGGPARLCERLERVGSEVGVDGQRVGERRRSAPRREVRRGVGLGGRADVAALAVGDHEQPALASERAHALGRREPVVPGLLEERQLRLDGHRVLARGLDDARAEALDRPRQPCGAVAHAAKELIREQLGPRVEPDAQHAPPLRRQPLETLPEAARHGHQAIAWVGLQISLQNGFQRRTSALETVLRHATAASSSARGWRPGGSGSRTGTRTRAAATRLSASASGAVQAIGTTPGARPAKACASSSASE